jgi:hypothetical protein
VPEPQRCIILDFVLNRPQDGEGQFHQEFATVPTDGDVNK